MANLPVNYNYDEIIAFPSSNATDQGVQYTEGNTQKVVLRITEMNYTRTMNDFVPRRTETQPYKVNVYAHYDIKAKEPVNDRPGLANIKGYAIRVQPGVIIQTGLPQPDELSKQTELSLDDPNYLEEYEEYVGYAYLCLQVIFDQNKNLRGDDFVSGIKKMMGIQLIYCTGAYYRKNKDTLLLLGWVNEDGSDIIDNEDKVNRIDPNTIMLKLEGDPIREPWNSPFPTHPPRQTVSLTEYVNNIMKSYYVSKGGDNEYGDITFRSSALSGYDNPKYSWKSQDRTSTNFTIKLRPDSKGNGIIFVKEMRNSTTTKTSLITPGRISFYQNRYKGDEDITNVDASISYGKDLSSPFVSKQLLEINNRLGGAVRLSLGEPTEQTLLNVSSNEPLFCLESANAQHNGVEPGKVIWGTNNYVTNPYPSSFRHPGNINYLVDSSGFIKSVQGTSTDNKANTITLANDGSINQVQIEGYLSTSPQPSLLLKKLSLQGTLTLSTSETSGFKNVVELRDNLVVKKDTASGLGGHIQAEGFIYSGSATDPTNSAQVSVPEFVNNDTSGNPTYRQRALKPGDIYGTQVWSAVYNDLAEMFEVDEDEYIKPGDVIACSMTKNIYTKVNKDNRHSVVGVVTDNPGFILGGHDPSKRHVPVALAGRVWVNVPYGLDFEKGDWLYIDSLGELAVSETSNDTSLGKIVEIEESRVRILIR